MPCVLLVLARFNIPGSKDAAYWQRGHVVDVRPQGASFGKRESIVEWRKAGNRADTYPGEYATIEVDDMDVAEAKSLFMQEEKIDTGVRDAFSEEKIEVIARRRTHKIDLPTTGYQFRMNRAAVIGGRQAETKTPTAEKERIKKKFEDKRKKDLQYIKDKAARLGVDEDVIKSGRV
jgi:hypothetical protein